LLSISIAGTQNPRPVGGGHCQLLLSISIGQLAVFTFSSRTAYDLARTIMQRVLRPRALQ
jgi:hypothetical protein